MHVLGINAYHGGASACLIRDGHLIAAAEEERFKRVKYYAGFPVEAIGYCLQEAKISAYELDHIGISADPSANIYRKILFTLSNRPKFDLIKDRLARAAVSKDLRDVFQSTLGLDSAKMRAHFHNVEHHLAHMASAFFVSPFEEAAILSVDGSGDFVTTMWGSGKGNRIDIIDSIYFPHSLGNFYTAVTQWLGFTSYGDEGKVMGLAPLGRPAYLDQMHKMVHLNKEGTFELDLDFLSFYADGATMTWSDGSPTLGILYSEEFVKVFGPARKPRTEITRHHMDVAASLQALLEEAEFGLVRMLHRKTRMKALCMAGGVALNGSFNGKILPGTDFEDIFIQPAAGDAGTALGAAYYIYHEVLGNPRTFVMKDSYTGPEFTNGRVKDVLESNHLTFVELPEEQLVRRAAEAVSKAKVLGWFQGRMEWGPRALGNRSIVADPRRYDMKDILNSRIKHREAFRPFAPSILHEAVGCYFDQSYPDPFMLKVYNVLKEKQPAIPAVTHVDGTGRLQTVDKDVNPLYWQLIKEFENLTGVPVILNTSFNENEPIVCRPVEAVDCFLRTRMDTLVLGNYFVEKRS